MPEPREARKKWVRSIGSVRNLLSGRVPVVDFTHLRLSPSDLEGLGVRELPGYVPGTKEIEIRDADLSFGTGSKFGTGDVIELAINCLISYSPVDPSSFFDLLDQGVPFSSMSEHMRHSFYKPLDSVISDFWVKSVRSSHVLLRWLEAAGFDRRHDLSHVEWDWLRRYAMKYFLLNLGGQAEYWLKHVTTTVMASHLDQLGTKPKCPPLIDPNEKHFLGGAAYTFVSSRCHVNQAGTRSSLQASLRMLQLVNNLKASQPPIGKDRIQQTIAEWGPKLSQSRNDGTALLPLSWVNPGGSSDGIVELKGWHYGPEEGPQPTFQGYTTYVTAIAKALSSSLRDRVTLGVPSSKARSDSSTAEGGSFGLLTRSVIESLTGWSSEDLDPTRQHNQDTFSKLSEAGKAFKFEGDLRDGRGKLHVGVLFECPVESIVRYRKVRIASYAKLNGETCEVHGYVPRAAEDIFTVGSWTDLMEGMEVIPVGLAEPFKVRMISKGPSLAYWRSSIIQKAMHTALQALPNFQLTKERSLDPLFNAAGIISKVLSEPLEDGECYASGDYKGATDELNPRCSSIVVEVFSEELGLSPFMSKLFMDSLVGHLIPNEIELPPAGGETETSYFTTMSNQKWGQLMGSPTSFPVLCIANLAMSMLALGKSSRPRDVHRCGIAVNGDDIGFKARPASYRRWQLVTSFFGLAPSQGKNFWSNRFLQLNSTMFIPSGRSPETWERVWCPQTSTLILPPLSPDMDLLSCFFILGPAWQRQFLDSSTGPDRDRLNSLFLSVWSDQLKEIPSHLMNWFAPRSLGGFGLEPTRVSEFLSGITNRQRFVANWFDRTVQPDVFSRNKVAYGKVMPTSSIHQDEKFLMDALSKGGFVHPAWISAPPVPIPTNVEDCGRPTSSTVLELSVAKGRNEESLALNGAATVLGLSGYSSHVSRDNVVNRLLLRPVDNGKAATGVRVEVLSEGRKIYMGTVLKTLIRAEKSAGAMSDDSTFLDHLVNPRIAGHQLAPGVTSRGFTLRAIVSTGKWDPTCFEPPGVIESPTFPCPFGYPLRVTFGKLLLLEDGRPSLSASADEYIPLFPPGLEKSGPRSVYGALANSIYRGLLDGSVDAHEILRLLNNPLFVDRFDPIRLEHLLQSVDFYQRSGPLLRAGFDTPTVLANGLSPY